MTLTPVPRPTVTFVAVSEQTSDRWAGVMLGIVGAVPWAFAIWLVYLLVHR